MRKFNQNLSRQTSTNTTVVSEPPPLPPLEKLVLLHNLYPKHFLEFMLSERVIQYTKSNLQALLDKTIPKTEKAQGANFSLSEITDKISFCPFLVGYKNEVANAFRNTLRVKKILKDTNSHIISLKKYLKCKDEFLEEHRAFIDAKEAILNLKDSSFSYLLVTWHSSLEEDAKTNSLEEIQKKLLGARSAGPSGSPGDPILKTTRIFELPTAFEEEIKIESKTFKDIMRKYEKLVAITPKITKENGKYYITFILTSFSKVDLFNKIEDELNDYFNDRQEIQLNHFELSYWKKRLQPSLKDLEATLNISVKFTEYYLSKDDWKSLFEKSHSNGRLEVTGQKINVNKFLDKVKFAFDQLYQYRIEVPIKISEWMFHEFKPCVWNWTSLIEAKLPDITFTNHVYQTTQTQDEEQKNNVRQNRGPPNNFLVFYALGPKDLTKEVEAAGSKAGRALSNIRSSSSKKEIQGLRTLAEEAGFKDLDELQDCFEILIKENPDSDSQNLPRIYGRKEDIYLFFDFQKKYRVIFDTKKLIYQEILLQTEEAEMAAEQCYVQIKIFSHIPKILILGPPENINNFIKNFLEKKLQSLQEKTKECPTEATEWLAKPSNSYFTRYLYRKYDVHAGELDPVNKKVSLVGEEPKRQAFLQEISNLALGKPILKEINIEGSDTNADTLLNLAKKMGLEAQFKDKDKSKGKDRNIIVVKGLYPKIKEFKGLAVKKEIREASLQYPRYWYYDANNKASLKMRYLQEDHPEYIDSAHLFNEAMKKDFLIKKIHRIQNEPLIVNFLKLHQALKRKENATKMHCFYASGDFNPAQIYQDFEVGFDLQFSNDPQKKGFWLSLDAKEAHDNHAYQTENGVFKMLVVDVIITNKVDVDKKEFLIDSGYLCYPIYLIEYINKK